MQSKVWISQGVACRTAAMSFHQPTATLLALPTEYCVLVIPMASGKKAQGGNLQTKAGKVCTSSQTRHEVRQVTLSWGVLRRLSS